MTQPEPRVYETVLFETEGNVATVTLNRPEVMNAFNRVVGPDPVPQVTEVVDHGPRAEVSP